MSAIFTEATRLAMTKDALMGSPSRFGIVLIVLLVILLVQKEYIRALKGARVDTWHSSLDIAIVPLMIAFGLMIFFWVLNILHPL